MLVRPEFNSRPPAWQPDAQPTEPPVAVLTVRRSLLCILLAWCLLNFRHIPRFLPLLAGFLYFGEVEPIEDGGLDRDCDGEARVNET